MTPETTAGSGGPWYIAECQDCQPVLPQPFRDEGARDEWAQVHLEATSHTILGRTE